MRLDALDHDDERGDGIIEIHTRSIPDEADETELVEAANLVTVSETVRDARYARADELRAERVPPASRRATSGVMPRPRNRNREKRRRSG